MLNFIDYLNNSNILKENCMLVSFDIVSMFPSTDNESGSHNVTNALEARKEQVPTTLCINEALELCTIYYVLFLIINISSRLMELLKVLISLALIVTSSLNNLAKKYWNIVLQLLVGEGFETIFF